MSRYHSVLVLIGLAALLLLGFASGCASHSVPSEQPSAGLPALPDDGPGWSRYVSETTLPIPGIGTFADSGEPGVRIHETQTDWLTMDGTADGEMAWAIWQFPLPDDANVNSIKINLQDSGFTEYWVFWADFSAGRWVLDGKKTLITSVTPPGPEVRSPGNYVYLALAVLPGWDLNVSSMEFTHDGTTSGNDPIFDQFEDNDTTADAYELAPGVYRASIHETFRADMTDPNEFRDSWDFYRIPLETGQHLTATLRYEVHNHFPPRLDLNDLDLLFFYAPTTKPLDDFIEDKSSLRIYYHPFEQINYTAEGNFDIYIGIRGDFGDVGSPKNDAEYDFGVHINDQVYEVSGFITQEGEVSQWDQVVFLEPGNYNAVTTYPPTGEFTIKGVPNGTYTLKAQKSVRDPAPPYDYFWPETTEVVVNNGDVTGVSLDIGPSPTL